MNHVIAFEKPPVFRFNHLIQINSYDKEPYIFLSRNDDPEGRPVYYTNAFISDWTLIQELTCTLQRIESDVRAGKITLKSTESRMLTIQGEET